MANKVKIELYEPNYSLGGAIYYSGIVAGIYTHFFGFGDLDKKTQRDRLLQVYLFNCNFLD